MAVENIDQLVAEVRSCSACDGLPLGPKPIFQMRSTARILIAGQAPGRITHQKGRPFDDPSGDRLRDWMGIDREIFYDAAKIAILPMGFCFPGTGKGGDLPPRPECAALWRKRLLAQLPDLETTLVIGRYALDWHVGGQQSSTVRDTVANWRQYWPEVLPMPHPSPRNNRWLRDNRWFVADVVPTLQNHIGHLLGS